MSRLASPIRKSFALAALLAAASCTPAAFADMKAYQQSVHSTVLIGNSNSMGTGALLDIENRLVVTAAHVVRGEEAVSAMFAQFRDGRIVQDLRAYAEEGERLEIAGRVIFRDEDRDIAIVQLDSLPEDAVAMPLAAASPQPGEVLFAIGNSTIKFGALFNYLEGHVRAVYSSVELGVRVVDTNIAVNHGDSGGPLLNSQGELVGVASYFVGDQNARSHFIDIEEIRVVLERAEVLAMTAQR
jgi:S1-C subfamily serine protease